MNLKFWTWFSKSVEPEETLAGSTITFQVDENSKVLLKVEFGTSPFPGQAARFANLVHMINNGDFRKEFLTAVERACNRQRLVNGIRHEILQSINQLYMADYSDQEEMDPESVFAMNSERAM